MAAAMAVCWGLMAQNFNPGKVVCFQQGNTLKIATTVPPYYWCLDYCRAQFAYFKQGYGWQSWTMECPCNATAWLPIPSAIPSGAVYRVRKEVYWQPPGGTTWGGTQYLEFVKL